MAVRTREEIIQNFSNIIGDRNDDTVLNFIEDISDTLADGETDYKKMYEDEVTAREQLDESWRKKYRERFETGVGDNDSDNDNNAKPPRKYTYESLFEEG